MTETAAAERSTPGASGTAGPDEAAAIDSPPDRQGLGRFLPLVGIAAVAVLVFATGAHRYLSLDALNQNREALQAFVAANFLGALAAYMLIYIAATTLSLPGATILSLLGGFLFGTLAGTVAVVFAATIGASLIFLAARSALGDALRRRAGSFVEKIEQGFSENAFSYLLILRLVPLFPFFIVNVAPAFTRIRLSTYVAATFIGIIPGAFAYVSAGSGLGVALEAGGDVALSGLLAKPEILTPIVALSALALLPVVMKAIRRRKSAAE